MEPIENMNASDWRARTRTGGVPNRGGRANVAAAFGRLLKQGERFEDPEAPVSALEIREWAARVRGVADELADTIEAPVRNRVLEALESSAAPDEANALEFILINALGESSRQFGAAAGVSGPTVDRVVSGSSCQVGVAKKIADRLGLATTELFEPRTLRVRTVADLRAVLLEGDARRRNRV